MRTAEVRKLLKDSGYKCYNRGKHEFWEKGENRIMLSQGTKMGLTQMHKVIKFMKKAGII